MIGWSVGWMLGCWVTADGWSHDDAGFLCVVEVMMFVVVLTMIMRIMMMMVVAMWTKTLIVRN